MSSDRVEPLHRHSGSSRAEAVRIMETSYSKHGLARMALDLQEEVDRLRHANTRLLNELREAATVPAHGNQTRTGQWGK